MLATVIFAVLVLLINDRVSSHEIHDDATSKSGNRVIHECGHHLLQGQLQQLGMQSLVTAPDDDEEAEQDSRPIEQRKRQADQPIRIIFDKRYLNNHAQECQT
jgi:hypothetical protein